MDVKQIKEIAEIMQENGLTLLELTQGDTSLRMERQAVQNIIIPTSAPAAPAEVSVQPAVAEPEEPKKYYEVKSPMVGVFYTSSSPESEPFVRVGSHVKKGDTVCIIEAMKLLNEISAECDGEIVEICVPNGQAVEYGQVLFRMNRE